LPFRFASVNGFALIVDQGELCADLPDQRVGGTIAKLLAANTTPITTRSPKAANAAEPADCGGSGSARCFCRYRLRLAP
jgi:hypothetical protein